MLVTREIFVWKDSLSYMSDACTEAKDPNIWETRLGFLMLEHLKSPNTKCFLTEILCPTLVYSKGLVGKPSPVGQNISLSSVLSLLSQVEVEKAFRDSLMGGRVYRCFYTSHCQQMGRLC